MNPSSSRVHTPPASCDGRMDFAFPTVSRLPDETSVRKKVGGGLVEEVS